MSDKTPSHSNSSASPESQYWFARHSKSIIFLILTLAVVGVYEALSLPIAVFPATNFPRIIIGVDNGVMPIEQMEVTITRLLENAVNSVPGLEDVRSTTSRGSAEVDLSFSWDVDMAQTLQLVNSEIARIQSSLPSTAQIESHRLDFASFPILGYSLTSDKIPQTQLWEIATYDIKPRLNRLNGVATVVIQGGQVPEFQVTPDPSKLLRARVTVQDILDAANHTNIVDSPGLLTRNHQLFLGLMDSQVHNVEDIGNMVIKNVNEAPVRVRDVGVVTASSAPNYTVVTANGKPAVLVSVSRQPQSNTVEVANLAHQEIEAIRPKLPAGVELNVFYDQSNIVRESIASVRDAIIIGLLLAGFIIWLFLQDWGTALMTGLVIPVAIFVTFIAMKILGQSFNMMTLGGLAAAGGLVIDDAIVVVENIVLHRDGGEGRLEAVNSALRELTVPLIGSTLTPIVVFLPLISITGVTGTFFRALAIAMSVSLLTSLALALTWSTNLGVHLIRRGKDEGESAAAVEPLAEDSENVELERMRRMMAAEEESLKGGWFERIIAFYEIWLRRALEHPVWLGGLCLLLIAGSYFCFNALGSDLLPAMDEGGFILDYVMPPGSSLQETNRVITHVENIIKTFPEVQNTSRRTGLQLGLAAVTEPNTGDIAVKLIDGKRRKIDEIISDIRAKVTTEEPSLDVEFVQVLQDMIADLTGAPQPVVVQLFSPDADEIATWAPRVADALDRIQINYKKPVVDIEDGIENTTSGPALVFNINPAAAAKAGFTTDQLTVISSAIVDGEPATAPLIINDRPYTLRVRFPAANRASLEAMNNLMIVNGNGGSATLGAVSTVVELPGQTEILRDNLQQEKEVHARLEGIDLGRGVAAVQKAVTDLHLPPSIRVAYGGTYKEQQKSFHDLEVVLLLALVLIFIVLLFEFRSFSAPVAILSSAVLSTSGVFFALLITRTDFNISSFMGLIMVLGIVAKNGILLLDANQKFRAVGFAAEEAMIQAGRRRLRPIVMTAMAAVAGMLPLSLAIGAGSQMLQPLAIAVIGGILISMVLSLIITPAMQYYLTREKEAVVNAGAPVVVR
jgi:multidrug efflux pump subunit AcrB